ncbi:MAG TPA: hypothetical protein VMT99_02540 [Candidatus Paceibacterota bacterium]|nr:hypothetical protein [Candidatus Paceibacterota bacterium]
MLRKAIGVFISMAAIGLIAVGFVGSRALESSTAGRMLAQVGVTLGIEPNPYNTLNAQLDAKQTQLEMEQADLEAQKEALASDTAASSAAASSPLMRYLIVIVGILALLVGLNFYFDWRRSEREANHDEDRGPAAGGGA